MLANDVKLAFCPDLTDNNEIKTQKIWEKFLDKNHGNFHKGDFSHDDRKSRWIYFFLCFGKDFIGKLLRDKHINTNLIRHDDHY